MASTLASTSAPSSTSVAPPSPVPLSSSRTSRTPTPTYTATSTPQAESSAMASARMQDPGYNTHLAANLQGKHESDSNMSGQKWRNIVVLGASYGGTRAAQILAKSLDSLSSASNYRVILIDRNSHANHLYVLPRLSVVPGHEHKAFIPYTNVYNPLPPYAPAPAPVSTSSSTTSSTSSSNISSSSYPSSQTSTPSKPPHIFIQATILALHAHHIVIDRAYPEYGFVSVSALDGSSSGGAALGSASTSASASSSTFTTTPETISTSTAHTTSSNLSQKHVVREGEILITFDYAIYALGSTLPEPINFWAGPSSSAYLSSSSVLDSDSGLVLDEVLSGQPEAELVPVFEMGGDDGAFEEGKIDGVEGEQLEFHPDAIVSKENTTDTISSTHSTTIRRKDSTSITSDTTTTGASHNATPTPASASSKLLNIDTSFSVSSASPASSTHAREHPQENVDVDLYRYQYPPTSQQIYPPSRVHPSSSSLLTLASLSSTTSTTTSPTPSTSSTSPSNSSPSPASVSTAPTSLPTSTSTSPSSPFLKPPPNTKRPTPTPTPTPYTGTKLLAMSLLRTRQQQIADAEDIVVVGGGALGIQFATDIASLYPYPSKRVTLIHSRRRLLNRFEWGLHLEVFKALQDLQITTILGDRLDLSYSKTKHTIDADGNRVEKRVVRTLGGKEIEADLVLLCTGQTPNTSLLSSLSPLSIVRKGDVDEYAYLEGLEQPVGVSDRDYRESRESKVGLARVLRTLQVAVPEALVPASVSMTDASSGESLSSPSISFSSPISSSTSSSRLEHNHVQEEDVVLITPHPHIFVVGDSADAFGAIKAGHNAYYQGEVAARNIARLIRRRIKEELAITSSLDTRYAQDNSSPSNIQDDSESNLEDLTLESYHPHPPAIKVSLGLTKSAYLSSSTIGTTDEPSAQPDLDAGSVWRFWGMEKPGEGEGFE